MDDVKKRIEIKKLEDKIKELQKQLLDNYRKHLELSIEMCRVRNALERMLDIDSDDYRYED